MGKVMRGFTDEAASKDLFAIQKYIDGLSTFVQNCNTPMTISIQGTWGTGKTSLMQIVQEKLEADQKTKCIWFNTWQFSQFNMDSELAVSLLSCLIEELTLSAEKKEKVNRTTQAIRVAQTVGKISKEALLAYIDSTIGGRFADGAESVMDQIKDAFGGSNSTMDSAKAIKELRNQFAECVKETLQNTQKERIVVFIDDLDRLEPRKAVELLEILKLFLDCKQCVFVLAIDYAVVCRGVEAKYGKLSDDAKESKEKGKSFFDKIIQVPFKLPVAEYDISNYVVNCFQEIGIPCSDDEKPMYVNLIKSSCGTNPRSMKRLFNTYLLLSIVVDKEILEKDENKQLLFAVLCLQYSFENVYEQIIRNIQEISADALYILASGEYQKINENAELEGLDISDWEAAQLKPFMEQFILTIDKDKDGKISEAEMNNVRSVLGISTITASADNGSGVPNSVIVKSVNEMNINGDKQEELDALIKRVVEMGDDISPSMRNNKHPHVLFKTRDGKRSFMDVYMRKAGFAIDCIANDPTVFNNPAIVEIKEKYNANISGRYFTMNAKDEDAIKELMIVAKACYDSYKGK